MEEEDKQALLQLAREAIETAYKDQEPNLNNVLHLNKEQGVFVTLHKHGELRGCIGFPEPIQPLFKAVIDAARSAAFKDSRFPTVTSDELSRIKIEISVLTTPEEITVEYPEEYKEKIVLGKDGLIIRSPEGSGLLLPQVVKENNFTTSQFLNALCQKAGLSFSAWENLDNPIFKFQAIIFSEE